MTNPTKIGRYEIIERVGRGGMGVLYRGRDTVLDREVAIKVMATEFDADSDDTARPRFYREARAAAKLQHRNIVTVFEFGEEDHTPFIVMEFLRGQDLAKRMRALPPLTIEEKLDIVADLCTGLHFAHEQGVVHRDVKPANIWLQTDGSIKLLDFGIAKFASSTMTRQGSVLGSVSYMAPEQIGGADVDGRADVFSAGVVLYELLTGQKPFPGDSPTAVLARIMDERPAPIDQLGPDVPKPLAAALAKALQKDREKRYAHAADFGADLRLVRSALSAIDPLTLDIELTRTMLQDAGATIVADAPHPEPAGAVSLLAGHSPGQPGGRSAAAGQGEPGAGANLGALARQRWAVPGIAALVLVVAVLGAYFARGSAPAGPPAAPAADAPSPQASPNPTAATVADASGAGAKAGSIPGADRSRRQPIVPASRPLPAGQQPQTPAPPAASEQPPAETPAGADVVITGSYPFDVWADGRLLSASASQHRVHVAGRQSLQLKAPEHFLDAAVVVDAGTRHVSAPELGRLQLRIPEVCSASIGGRNLGEPPYSELQVAAGSYRVQMTCPDGSTRNVPIVVRAGELRQAIIAK